MMIFWRFTSIRKETIKALQDYEWPGNIRELENTVERAILMCESNYLTAEDLNLLPGQKVEEPKLAARPASSQDRAIENALKVAADWVWGAPLLVLLCGSHLFLTVRLRFIQRYLGRAIRISLERGAEGEGDVSQFGALTTALAFVLGFITLRMKGHYLPLATG